jgi:signal peptidase I
MTAVLPVRRPGAASALPPAADERSAAAHRAGPTRRILGHLTPWLVRGTLGLAIVAFLGLAAGPHVFGYRTMTMLTSSMAPEIEAGDVTVVTPIAVSEITEGMVITYHIPVDDHRVVTHRVVSVESGPAGTVTVQTKGDANEAVDPWDAVLQGDTAYEVRAVLPEVGHVIQLLRHPAIAPVLLYGAPTLLVGWLLLSIWRPTREEEDPA